MSDDFDAFTRERNIVFATEDEFLWSFFGFVWRNLEGRRREWQALRAHGAPPEWPPSDEPDTDPPKSGRTT
ncbi:hypothetical protein LVJ94_34530 [Pendulispora rubella]|uniref:Uncharacterized protein n=1 Tax=Pendulispora rubella TaxID=2741070 RepID=A0ABZ2KTK2_9BACT